VRDLLQAQHVEIGHVLATLPMRFGSTVPSQPRHMDVPANELQRVGLELNRW